MIVHEKMFPKPMFFLCLLHVLLAGCFGQSTDGDEIIPSDAENKTCVTGKKPEPGSCSFRHEQMKEDSILREAAHSNDCIPERATEFCLTTIQHRNDVIMKLESELATFHIGCDRTTLYDAIVGCFGDCGTCVTGEIYEAKKQNCDNFLHWMPSQILYETTDTANIFMKGNKQTRMMACKDDARCIVRTRTFALIAPAVYKMVRLDPALDELVELYSYADNPLPVYTLYEDMFVIEASGIIKFWIIDDSEMIALKRPLEVIFKFQQCNQVAMLYNLNATRIDIYVADYNSNSAAVEKVVEDIAKELKLILCPNVTRQTLTPYSLLAFPDEWYR